MYFHVLLVIFNVWNTDFKSKAKKTHKTQICLHRSEGFSRTGYFLPARGSPGVSPDGEGSWDAAAAVVAVTWNFRSTFWLGNYIWSLSLWNWTQMGHLGTSVPGFCTEFRYLSYGQSGLAWGAIFEKSSKIKKIHFLRKWTCPKNPEMSLFRENIKKRKKTRRRPNVGNTAGSFEEYLTYEPIKNNNFKELSLTYDPIKTTIPENYLRLTTQ